jgi:2-polyprenyl-3-methyl-5-hydroxy-6-metoxy-1,4-benzoquinol methylase
MTSPDPAPTSLYDRTVRRILEPEGTRKPCEICGDERMLPTYRVGGVTSPIVVCRTCGLGRFHPMLSSAQIRSLYPEEYYGEPGSKFRPLIERPVRAVAARHIAFLSRGLPAGAAILDVGCGRGVNFGPLADRGFRVFGIEVNEEAIRGCDPRAEVRIAERLSEAEFAAGSFDEVIIWHVLEHMTDPFDTIEECARILAPGGRLIVAVPNFSSAQARLSGSDWFHLDPPRHLYHFPYQALCTLVEKAGFDVESSHHFSLRQNPFGWIQSALNRFTNQPTDGLYTLLHRGSVRDRAALPIRTRIAMWVSLVVGAPFAIALSLLASWLRTGATVHIVAVRRPSG